MTTPRTMPETLRAVADLIEAHPDLPLPLVNVYDYRPEQGDLDWFLMVNGRAKDEADQKAIATAIIRALGGKWDKAPTGDDFRFRQTRGGLNFNVQVHREAVCERVVVGTESVTLPAVEAQPARTETVEKVEWRCEPLLAEAAR